jgi:hypothetical protein
MKANEWLRLVSPGRRRAGRGEPERILTLNYFPDWRCSAIETLVQAAVWRRPQRSGADEIVPCRAGWLLR